ncbi:MAG: twin-arginine translocase TatA/TatE family subunit [Phycisphaerae bacterium]
MMLAFINGISPMHILLVAFVALLLFGNRLPDVARSLGRSLNEFKKGLKDVDDEFQTKDQPSERLGAPRKTLDEKVRNAEIASEPTATRQDRGE